MSAGAERLKSQLSIYHRTPSEFGCKVADLLDALYDGIYHIDVNVISAMNWESDKAIIIILPARNWATVDLDLLTRLVFLAHHHGVRVEIGAANTYPNSISLKFDKVTRRDFMVDRHPSMGEAAEKFRERMAKRGE